MIQLIQLNTALHPYRPISVYVKCILVSALYVKRARRVSQTQLVNLLFYLQAVV